MSFPNEFEVDLPENPMDLDIYNDDDYGGFLNQDIRPSHINISLNKKHKNKHKHIEPQTVNNNNKYKNKRSNSGHSRVYLSHDGLSHSYISLRNKNRKKHKNKSKHIQSQPLNNKYNHIQSQSMNNNNKYSSSSRPYRKKSSLNINNNKKKTPDNDIRKKTMFGMPSDVYYKKYVPNYKKKHQNKRNINNYQPNYISNSLNNYNTKPSLAVHDKYINIVDNNTHSFDNNTQSKANQPQTNIQTNSDISTVNNIAKEDEEKEILLDCITNKQEDDDNTISDLDDMDSTISDNPVLQPINDKNGNDIVSSNNAVSVNNQSDIVSSNNIVSVNNNQSDIVSLNDKNGSVNNQSDINNNNIKILNREVIDIKKRLNNVENDVETLKEKVNNFMKTFNSDIIMMDNNIINNNLQEKFFVNPLMYWLYCMDQNILHYDSDNRNSGGGYVLLNSKIDKIYKQFFDETNIITQKTSFLRFSLTTSTSYYKLYIKPSIQINKLNVIYCTRNKEKYGPNATSYKAYLSYIRNQFKNKLKKKKNSLKYTHCYALSIENNVNTGEILYELKSASLCESNKKINFTKRYIAFVCWVEQ